MPTDSEIRVLVFDIGQVIVRVNPRRTARALVLESASGTSRLLQIIHEESPIKESQDGRLSAKEWYRYLRKLLGLRVDFRQFCTAWNMALDVQPILDEASFAGLAERFRLVPLSNTDPIHVAHMHENYQFPQYFEHQLYSCALGACKPEPAVCQ